MTNAAFYSAEAKRYRERAAATKDPEQAEQLIRFAKEQETLAALVAENGDQPQQQQTPSPEDESPP